MSERDPLAWWRYVRADLVAIEALTAHHDVPWTVVASHAQQAAEKALKAVIVAGGATAPRVHDVGRLLRDVQRLTNLGNELQLACDRLTEVGAISRYPDDAVDVSEQEARRAMEHATQVVDASRELLVAFGVRVP